MDTLLKILSNPELMAMAGIGMSISLIMSLIAIRVLWKKLQKSQEDHLKDTKEMYKHYNELVSDLDKTVRTLLKVVKKNGSYNGN